MLSREAHAVELRRFTRRSPIAPRCGNIQTLDDTSPCRDHAGPTPIGCSQGHGVTQLLYQCPVCHSVLTENQAFHA